MREKLDLSRHEKKKIVQRECEATIENDGQLQTHRKRIRCDSSRCEGKTMHVCSECKAPICRKCTKLFIKFWGITLTVIREFII